MTKITLTKLDFKTKNNSQFSQSFNYILVKTSKIEPYIQSQCFYSQVNSQNLLVCVYGG